MTDINELIDAVSLKMCTDYGEAPDCVRHHRPVAKAAIEATMKWLADRSNMTPEMVGNGWRKLRRDHLPKLGAGPGFIEAFAAALSVRIKELEARE